MCPLLEESVKAVCMPNINFYASLAKACPTSKEPLKCALSLSSKISMKMD